MYTNDAYKEQEDTNNISNTTQSLQCRNKDGHVIKETMIVTQNKTNTPMIVNDKQTYDNVLRLSYLLKDAIEKNEKASLRCILLNKCIAHRYRLTKIF